MSSVNLSALYHLFGAHEVTKGKRTALFRSMKSRGCKSSHLWSALHSISDIHLLLHSLEISLSYRDTWESLEYTRVLLSALTE